MASPFPRTLETASDAENIGDARSRSGHPPLWRHAGAAREFWIADRISDDPDIRRAASISEAPGNALRLLGTRWADPAIEARIEAGRARVRLGIRIAEVSLAEAFTGPASGTNLPRILDLLAIELQGRTVEFMKTFSAVEDVPEASAPA